MAWLDLTWHVFEHKHAILTECLCVTTPCQRLVLLCCKTQSLMHSPCVRVTEHHMSMTATIHTVGFAQQPMPVLVRTQLEPGKQQRILVCAD